MPIIFEGNLGRVVALTGAAGTGTLVVLGGWGGFSQTKAIFTRLAVAQQVQRQVQQMLGDDIYLYVFGDQMGQLMLSGLAFNGDCNNNPPGIAAVLNYYENFRLANNGQPIRVTINPSTTLECYLVGMSGDIVSAESRLFQFGFTFDLVPPRSFNPNGVPAGGSAGGVAGGSGGGSAADQTAQEETFTITGDTTSASAGVGIETFANSTGNVSGFSGDFLTLLDNSG